MLGTAAGSFEAGAVDGVKLVSGVGIDVIGVAADEGNNESVGVGVIPIVDGLPDALRDLVYLMRVAGDGAGGFVIGARPVTGKCGKWLGLFAPEGAFESFMLEALIEESSDKPLPSKLRVIGRSMVIGGIVLVNVSSESVGVGGVGNIVVL